MTGYVLKANVGVDNEESAEDSIGNGVQGAGSEGSNGQGNEACRDDPESWISISSFGPIPIPKTCGSNKTFSLPTTPHLSFLPEGLVSHTSQRSSGSFHGRTRAWAPVRDRWRFPGSSAAAAARSAGAG